MEIMRTGDGKQEGPVEWFTGEVWFEKVTLGPTPPRLNVMKVHFPPGARTAWHTHPAGQVVHVIDGTGLITERGGTITQIRVGDFAITEPGVWHWHGATPDTAMTHLAIQQTDDNDIEFTWGEHVTDAEYLTEPVLPTSVNLPPIELDVADTRQRHG